jgi:hypothetical protein
VVPRPQPAAKIKVVFGCIKSHADIRRLPSQKSRVLSRWCCSILRSLTFLLLYVFTLLCTWLYSPCIKTQRYVRLYNLAEQKLLKTLMPGIQWISSMDVHPSGDHVIVGGYDRKLCWFDLELSEKPYKVLRYVIYFDSKSVINFGDLRPAITQEPYDRSTSTQPTLFLRLHPTMAPSKSSTRGSTVTL